jgi:hypothetical protein
MTAQILPRTNDSNQIAPTPDSQNVDILERQINSSHSSGSENHYQVANSGFASSQNSYFQFPELQTPDKTKSTVHLPPMIKNYDQIVIS